MLSPIYNKCSRVLSAPGPQLKSTNSDQRDAGHVNELDTTAMMLQTIAADVTTRNVNQFELSFEQFLQSATSVDPSTGQRELSLSADSQLSAALNSFLTESGFSAQQADFASASFGEQLASNGPISLSSSFASTSVNAFSVSAGYGPQTTSASGISVCERSGSVSIEFDPATGKLAVSLENQQTGATASITEPSASGSISLRTFSLPQPNTVTGLNSKALGGDTSCDALKSDARANEITVPSDASTRLLELISGLEHPTLHFAEDASDLISLAATNEHTGGEAAPRSSGPTDDTEYPLGAQATAIKVGFTQLLYIAKRDLTGHGTTLFKRAHGATGAISFQPTRIEA